jgi:cathepsin B
MKTSMVMMIGSAVAAPPDRLAMIAEIQQTPGVLWTAGVNERFGHQPIGASKPLLGVTPEAMAKRAAYAKAHKHEQLTSVELPESFDSETNWPQCAKVIGDIRDQSMCGCCWAFGAASAASDRLCIATNATAAVPLSAEDVCFCASMDGCNGGDISSPWDYIGSSGAVTGGQYQGTGPFGKGLCQDFSLPHCHHHGPQGKDPYPAEGSAGCPEQHSAQCPTQCDAGASTPHANFTADKWSFAGGTQSAQGEDGIAQAIMAGGPVEVAFDVYDDFENYVSGIYHHVTGKMGGGHAVRIVGWGVEGGVKYWKVANSWNPFWGEKGYFRIKKGENECGIENQVTFSAANAKWVQGTPGPSPGGCDAQQSESACEAAGCEWLAAIRACVDKAIVV